MVGEGRARITSYDVTLCVATYQPAMLLLLLSVLLREVTGIVVVLSPSQLRIRLAPKRREWDE